MHIYQEWATTDKEILRRQEVAKASWERLGLHSVGIKERGLVESVMSCRGNELVLTNTDTCLPLNANLRGLYCSARIDYPHVSKHWIFKDAYYPEKRPLGEHCGTDLFVFKRYQFKQWIPFLEGLQFGLEGWDWLLWQLIVKAGGYRKSRPCCYHEKHEQKWSSATSIENLKIINRSCEKLRLIKPSWLVTAL